jgi:methanol--5-hydroxybenzimidazolylcobamide Co-methyltransferase
MAPTVSFEQLVYDCRLMNGASARGKEAALLLRDLHADSDSPLDPQAYVLRPDVVLRISAALVRETGYYGRTKRAAELALEEIGRGHREGHLALSEREEESLHLLEDEIALLPGDEAALTALVMDDCEKLDPKKYDM